MVELSGTVQIRPCRRGKSGLNLLNLSGHGWKTMKDCHRRYRWRGDGPLEGASGEEAFGLEQAGGGWGGQI